MQVTFVQPDGDSATFTANSNDTLLDVALDNGVAGIKGQCGGGCTCCTCHCWVDRAWLRVLPMPHQDELDMLEYAWGRADNSRLACQIPLSPALDGIIVKVPAHQS